MGSHMNKINILSEFRWFDCRIFPLTSGVTCQHHPLFMQLVDRLFSSIDPAWIQYDSNTIRMKRHICQIDPNRSNRTIYAQQNTHTHTQRVALQTYDLINLCTAKASQGPAANKRLFFALQTQKPSLQKSLTCETMSKHTRFQK